jgi:hypothetical protein
MANPIICDSSFWVQNRPFEKNKVKLPKHLLKLTDTKPFDQRAGVFGTEFGCLSEKYFVMKNIFLFYSRSFCCSIERKLRSATFARSES